MKQICYVVVFFTLTLVISACGNPAEEQENVQESEQENKEAEEQTDEQTEGSQEAWIETETDENDNEQEETGSEGEITEQAPEPEYTVSDTWSIVPKDDANEEVVLLTIDDAPDGHALEMAETLYELEANAIFFVNGHFLNTPEDEEILREIYDMGFYIGNHTYNHPFLPDISEEEQTEEILDLSDRVEEIIGERPRFFRAPNGANTDHVIDLVEEEGMILMNWSYGYDWEEEYRSREAIADIMVNAPELNNGANLLMHDREWTAEALEDIVQGLRDQGYEMVDPGLIE
ncbi:polysaccharide deacetylase family protein [Virgibacillus kimchii]